MCFSLVWGNERRKNPNISHLRVLSGTTTVGFETGFWKILCHDSWLQSSSLVLLNWKIYLGLVLNQIDCSENAKNDMIDILISRSAHRTTNFTNPELQFPQFKVLQSVFIFSCVKSYIGIFWRIVFLIFMLPIFTNKVSKQKFVAKIRDSYCLFVWGERDNILKTTKKKKKSYNPSNPTLWRRPIM